MTVSIALGARGHAYSVARYFSRQAQLHRLYTYYPTRFMAPDVRAQTRSFPYLFLGLSALSKIKMPPSVRMQHFANQAFSKWVAAKMEPVDLFMAMSGFGLYSRRAARKSGAFCVCDRGSTHIRCQDNLLAEEFDRWGAAYSRMSPEYIREEEAEYEESDLVVAQSSFAYESFVSQGYPRNKLAWISPGVDTKTFFPGDKQDDVFRVLFLGQIGLRKGIGYLLDSVPLFANSKTEIVLAGTLMPEAQPLLRRYEGRFRYAGSPANKDEIRKLFHQTSVFVLPSVEDGYGLVINEAMACGIPVVASTNSGGPDVIQNGRQGFVVPARSAGDLAEKLAYLQTHSAAVKEMGREALATARANDWDAYGQRVANLYRTALLSRKTASAG